MQHFNGKDLLSMSEVLKNWNKLVAAEISEKFTLNLPDDVREYQDMTLTRKYKHVTMILGNVSKHKALSKVASSVEDLKVIEKEEPVNFSNPDSTAEDVVNEGEQKLINFPNLKSLDLQTISNVEDFFLVSKIRMNQLEELKMKSNCRIYDAANIMCSCCELKSLQNQKYFALFIMSLEKLRSLDLYEADADFFNTIEGEFWWYPNFQLDFMKCRYVEPFMGIPMFMSVKTLTVMADSINFPQVLGDFKELTTLNVIEYINNGFCRVRRDASYPENKSIKHLSIEPVRDISFKEGEMKMTARKLLRATPEVETLYVYSLDPEFIRFIAETNLKMKTVKYTEVWKDTFEEYEDMKQTQPNINRDIQFIQEDFEFEW